MCLEAAEETWIGFKEAQLERIKLVLTIVSILSFFT